MRERILLVDGHNILHRAYYGMPMLTTSKGLHTNAVYGFINILFSVMEEVKPKYLGVAFDMSAPTFRHKMYDAYKGNRSPMPSELKEQVPLMKQVLEKMNVKQFGIDGIEADDIIGTISRLSVDEGLDVVILSGDRDLLQLVNEHVTLKLPRTSRGVTTVENFTPEHVREVYKIDPIQIIDLKAMMGDSSDNIPGLPGVGEKTATKLVAEYGSLENAHEHFQEITPKRAREAICDNYELGVLSKELATIKTDVDLGCEMDEMLIKDMYTKEAYDVFKELEFKSHYHKFDGSNKETSEFEIVISEEFSESAGYFDEALKAKKMGFYLDIRESEICGLALVYDEKTVYIKQGGLIRHEYLKAELLKIIDAVSDISTYEFKQQQRILKADDRENIFDCEIAAYLIDPLRSAYTYDYIYGEYADGTILSMEEIVGEKITKKTVIRDEHYIKAACFKAYTAYKTKEKLRNILVEKGMDRLFDEIEMPLVYTLSDMENCGIGLNSAELASFSEKLGEKLVEIEKKIYEAAGEEFNIQSPKQLSSILFEKLKLPGGKKTKTGYSTAADVLEKLAEDAPIVSDILEYRQLAKLKSTYADALGSYVEDDGRVHTHFLQSVTATGRLSSADPNLQNIPIRMELGRQIRKVFVPKEGNVFIDADYSQIELRVLAHFANDERLIEAYRKNSDIHRITATQVFGVQFEDVTPLQRRNAKAVNFGIVYGISSFGLSQGLSISRAEAQEYIEKYFKTYPGIKQYLDKAVAEAKKDGYSVTMFGRRRAIPELGSGNFMQRKFGERVAMNSPIQGTAADIIKIAMNNVRKRLADGGFSAKLILQVHDELLIETPKCEADGVGAILKEEMENAVQLRVPLIIDMNTGVDWYEAH